LTCAPKCTSRCVAAVVVAITASIIITEAMRFILRLSYKSDAKRAAVFALNNHHYVMKTLCSKDEPIVSHALCDASRLVANEAAATTFHQFQ
jgi:hypothetical protein